MLERGHAQDGDLASEEKMRDELVTMLSGGPTATSLASVFERLLRYPKKLARLRGEVLRDQGEEYPRRPSLKRPCGSAPPSRL